MAKSKHEANDAAPSQTVDMARFSRFFTNILGTPACHNFHAEAAALREIVGYVPPEQPEPQEHRAGFGTGNAP
jgi:hypothetical protein